MNDQLMKDAQYAKWRMPRMPQIGKIFFVSASGDDNNPGNKPECPVQKIATAVGLCTAGANDYIFILDAWSSDTEPIVIGKTHVHIVGIDNPQNPWIILNASADTWIMQITTGGQDAEVAGISFGGGDTHGGLIVNAPTGVWVHDCAFGHHYAGDTPAYGIKNDGATNPADMLIEDCRFFGNGNNAQGTITIDGIHIDSSGNAFLNSIVRNNIFLGIPGIGISLEMVQAAIILNNRFMCDADTAGSAITLAANCNGCYIDGNRANFGRDNAMGQKPYVDASGDDSNTWGLNYQGGASAYPD